MCWLDRINVSVHCICTALIFITPIKIKPMDVKFNDQINLSNYPNNFIWYVATYPILQFEHYVYLNRQFYEIHDG